MECLFGILVVEYFDSQFIDLLTISIQRMDSDFSSTISYFYYHCWASCSHGSSWIVPGSSDGCDNAWPNELFV